MRRSRWLADRTTAERRLPEHRHGIHRRTAELAGWRYSVVHPRALPGRRGAGRQNCRGGCPLVAQPVDFGVDGGFLHNGDIRQPAVRRPAGLHRAAAPFYAAGTPFAYDAIREADKYTTTLWGVVGGWPEEYLMSVPASGHGTALMTGTRRGRSTATCMVPGGHGVRRQAGGVERPVHLPGDSNRTRDGSRLKQSAICCALARSTT